MKKVLLAGLVSVAGAASLLAAEVTSINAVGYVNATLAPGFTMIANPLNAQDVSVPALFANAPDGVRVFKYENGTFVNQRKQSGGTWTTVGGTNLTLNPGEGAFFSNPFGTNITVTFVGEVQTGNLSNFVPTGFSVRSSQVPQQGGLQTALNFPIGPGDLFYRLQNGSYVLYRVTGSGTWQSGNEPVINPAEAFWAFRQTANGSVNWTRTFSIN